MSATGRGRNQRKRATGRERLSIVIGVAILAAIFIARSQGGEDTAGSGDTAADTQQGAEVYAAQCASCHGADLRGTILGPSHLSIVYEPNHHGDDSFANAIANGTPQHHWPFGDMPPIKGLDQDEVDAVIAFVRAEQQRQGFEN